MKTTFFLSLLLVVIFTTASSAQKISFEQTTIDYGTLEQAANGVRFFKFTNTGTAPLVINHAQGSCGCTIPKWPQEPILPGASAQIEVSYDTNRLGGFTKHVTITSNDTENTSTQLMITGTIVEKQSTTAPSKEKS